MAMEVQRVVRMAPRGGLHMPPGRRSLHKLVVWMWKVWAHSGVCTCCWGHVVCTSWWCGGGGYGRTAGSAHAALVT